MDYTTVDKVQDYMLTDIADAYKSKVNFYIKGISRHMDKMCGRTLVADTAETRLFYGRNRSLLIDEVRAISAIDIGSTALSTAEYMATPNSPSHPIYQINAAKFLFNYDNAPISITGKFGYFADTVPDDISMAATILAAGVLRNVQSDGQEITSEKIGDYSASFATGEQKADYQMAMAVINNYKRIL
jgi:hypothetical protein